jgi:LmbE family N-acetylglucosaminyl deacetylase
MNILAIGAHPDDIEYGVGGTIAKLVRAGHNVTFLILTYGETIGDPNVRKQEAIDGAKALGVKNVLFGNLKDSFIKHDKETIDIIERVIAKVKPDRIYTIYVEDSHQDHRNTALSTISAGRDTPSIIFYECPSVFSNNFNPHLFVDITDTIQNKFDALKVHVSQNKKSFMDMSAIEGLAKFRGFQTRMKIKYAEAFHIFRHLEY